VTPLYPQKLALNFVDKWRLISRYSSLADKGPRSLFISHFVGLNDGNTQWWHQHSQLDSLSRFETISQTGRTFGTSHLIRKFAVVNIRTPHTSTAGGRRVHSTPLYPISEILLGKSSHTFVSQLPRPWQDSRSMYEYHISDAINTSSVQVI
jgi:hypothetical protein